MESNNITENKSKLSNKSLITIKNQLLDELSQTNINIVKIRGLCRSYPGLIAQTGLRLKIWGLLLLGKLYDQNEMSNDLPILNNNSSSDTVECDEQHVLDADINRTRAEIQDFRTSLWRKSIGNALQYFCLKHKVQYKQGMNEVLAPFIYLSPPPNLSLPYMMFEGFIFRYLERYFCLDDSGYLFKAFRLFHLLLLYHDPQLALHMQDNDFPPELYSLSWFLTLYSRSLPMLQVLRLWDMLIAIDDPAFTFFIGLCLLRKLRLPILSSDTDSLPEILTNLSFHGEDDIDFIVTDAIALYKFTPRCFIRYLRLCCVSTFELTPNPQYTIKSNNNDNNNSFTDIHDRNMAIQSARLTVTLTPQELISSLLPIVSNNDLQDSMQDDKSLEYSTQQFVLIDIRTIDTNDSSGSGIIPRAITIDPEFLDHPDVLDKWIQHFDSTRGCNICLIDLPPSQASNVSLWRRLILGEGDGYSNKSNLVSYGQSIKSLTNSTNQGLRDLDSKYLKEEEQAMSEDLLRPSVKLAKALQRSNFPNVCILDGGYPALIQQLIALRGDTEPLVINHNNELFEKFLISTGREIYSINNIAKKINKSKVNNSINVSNITNIKKIKDMNEIEKYEIAYMTAKKLGHETIATILLDKLLTSKQKK